MAKHIGSAIFCALLLSCQAQDPTSTNEAIGAAASTSEAASSSSGDTRTSSAVSRADFEARGLKWPLSVDQARLGCTDEARWAEVGGTRYGLNGTASVARGFAEVEPIWLEDEAMAENLKALGAPNDPPLRVNIGDMIVEAGKLC